MIHNQKFQLCHVCTLHLSRDKLSIQLQFFYDLSRFCGSISYCIIKTRCDLWLSFRIMIWKTLNIYKTCWLSFYPWIHPLHYSIFYIWGGNNITSISICLLIFFVIKFPTPIFWKYTTPIIINILSSVVTIYIFVVNICTMMYKVKKYWFV